MSEQHSQDDIPQNNPVSYPLASRGQRLAAAILDQLILSLVLLPFWSYYDIMSYFNNGQQIPLNIIINIQIVSFIAFMLLNSYLLFNYGQSIGKQVMQIAIATPDLQVPAFNKIILLRYVPFIVAGVIPFTSLIPMIDVLCIFRKDKRCLHDMLASTQVIYIGDAK